MSTPLRTARYTDIPEAIRLQLAMRVVARSSRDANGCMVLAGTPLHSGHMHVSVGTFRPTGRGLRAHRPERPYFRVRAHVFAWEMANRRNVPEGYVVMHRCDVPRCVNPDHLTLGTQGDNVRDSVCKGRYNAFGRQRLNAEKVREIRRRVRAGETYKSVALDFDIAPHSVGAIAKWKAWAHLDPLDAVFERVPHVVVPVRGEVS